MTFPLEGQRFAIDPDGPSRQEIVLTAAATTARARFIVDGQAQREQPAPLRLPWRLSPGAHQLVVESEGTRSRPVSFSVY